MAQNTPNRQLYDLLVSKNYDIQALDSRTGRGPVNDQGQPDINTADEFRFDFVSQSGRNYGSVVILFGDDNNLTMFFGDNVGRGMETEDKREWFDFLYQIKQFATKNFLDFQPENITKLKYTKQGQAAIKEGLFESWQGRGNMSWNGQPTEARLLIKHKKALGEGEARFRYIESIYIETADQERFKMKSRSLTAAKAMLEHVRQGGNPYDARAQHINEIVTELAVLSRFRRANAGRILEGDTKNLVEQTDAYYQNMHSVLKHLGTSRGYQGYFESWSPADVNEGNLVVEDLKQLFVEQTIDHRIEEALPILARITQEANTMKEAKIFESWINHLVEGTWALPETPEQKQTLIDLMSKDFPVGADATNATEQLYDVFGDDELFDRLQELADADANADARSVVMTRMQELKSASPDVEAVLGQLQTTNPAEPTVSEPDQQPVQGVAEGSLDDIEDTRQFRNAIALAKSQKAIRQARYGKDQKFYADGTPVTPAEVARRAAARKAKKQGVAEYGDTAKGQKMLTKVHKRAVDRTIRADDKNKLEPDYTKRDLTTVRKNQATADRAWDRMSDLDLDEASVYKKDQDLSSVSTQELEAFVRKHWGGGIPTYGQGESVKPGGAPRQATPRKQRCRPGPHAHALPPGWPPG